VLSSEVVVLISIGFKVVCFWVLGITVVELGAVDLAVVCFWVLD